MSTVETPRIDEYAIVAGQRLAEGRPLRHHEAISTGQICGWRSLAAAIVCQGIQRAKQNEHTEVDAPFEPNDTTENARRFVLGRWGLYLMVDVCGIDEQQVQQMRAEWAEQWEAEARQYEAETAQHEALPASLLPEEYKKDQRAEAIWG